MARLESSPPENVLEAIGNVPEERTTGPDLPAIAESVDIEFAPTFQDYITNEEMADLQKDRASLDRVRREIYGVTPYQEAIQNLGIAKDLLMVSGPGVGPLLAGLKMSSLASRLPPGYEGGLAGPTPFDLPVTGAEERRPLLRTAGAGAVNALNVPRGTSRSTGQNALGPSLFGSGRRSIFATHGINPLGL